MLRLLKVRGTSLWPEYRAGDFVLAASVPFPSRKIKSGDVIIFQQPGYGMLIKRVQEVLEDGHAFEVRGTQVSSSDSRNFGPVPKARVSGKVIWHFRAQ
jgi:phage repressor protein C with HTH and peptisase S24 domain